MSKIFRVRGTLRPFYKVHFSQRTNNNRSQFQRGGASVRSCGGGGRGFLLRTNNNMSQFKQGGASVRGCGGVGEAFYCSLFPLRTFRIIFFARCPKSYARCQHQICEESSSRHLSPNEPSTGIRQQCFIFIPPITGNTVPFSILFPLKSPQLSSRV